MDQIDNYKIVKKIGEGGMGEVYKGVDVMLEREVAIKLLRPELSSRDDIVQRFRSEAIALGRLNHPNIAAVYNFGRTHDQYYMALEFVNGETLDGVIKKEGRLDWQTAIQYILAVLEGLDHAHSFHIVHRDIKPANIIITELNTVKILDFGIARILEKARLTKTGHLVGTLEYVSPEQIQGKETDARSDIYSVGVVLYEMLTGHLPFEKDTEYDLIRSQIEESPKPPRTFSGEIPAQIERLVLKALEKRPEKRFSSAREFSKELQKLSEHLTAQAPATVSSPLLNFCRDYPGIVFLLLLVAFGVGYFFWLLKKETPITTLPEPPVSSIAPIPAAPDHNVPESAKLQPLQPIQMPEEQQPQKASLPPPENLPPIAVEEQTAPDVSVKPASNPVKPKVKPKIKPKTKTKTVTKRKNEEETAPDIGGAAKSFFNN